jgi:long-chain acyl-CoA synthetase
MIAYCADKLAKYKWPTEIEFRKELPKTNVGKVLKKTCVRRRAESEIK